MKSFLGLIAGILIGSCAVLYVGYTRPAAQVNRNEMQFFKTMEWDDSKAAHFAVKSIPVVHSGDTEKAVQLLALSIADWYRVYAGKTGTNEERLNLRDKIERLASTNPVVAAEIHRKLR